MTNWSVILLVIICSLSVIFAFPNGEMEPFPDSLKIAIPAILATYAAFVAARLNRKAKVTDVVLRCAERDDALTRERTSMLSNPETYEDYYRRYWGLKSDQFDWWLAGLIDPDNMVTWMQQVLRAFLEAISEQDEKKFFEFWNKIAIEQISYNTEFVKTVYHLYAISAHYYVDNLEAFRDRLDRESENKRHRDRQQERLLAVLKETERENLPFFRFSEGYPFLWQLMRPGSIASYQYMEEDRRKWLEARERGMFAVLGNWVSRHAMTPKRYWDAASTTWRVPAYANWEVEDAELAKLLKELPSEIKQLIFQN